MGKRASKRVCVDRATIGLLQRDGMGWGHDLDCGCFEISDVAAKPSAARRFWSRLTGRV